MYNAEVLLLVFALLANTKLSVCGRSYLRLQKPSIQDTKHALRPESSGSLVPSGLAHQHQRTWEPAAHVSLAARTSNQQRPLEAWQAAGKVAQPLRRKHQHSAAHRTGRRHLLFVWMPTWTESTDSVDSSGSNSSSSTNSSEGSSTRSAAAQPAPTEGCSGKSGRTFYAQLCVLLAVNVTLDDVNSLSALEANVSGAFEAMLQDLQKTAGCRLQDADASQLLLHLT
jgi:hypothetical protein